MWPGTQNTVGVPVGFQHGELQNRVGSGTVYNPSIGGLSIIAADDVDTNVYWTGFESDLQVNGVSPGAPYQLSIEASPQINGPLHAYQTVIGVAYEVHNTTNVLNTQGSLTAWQLSGRDRAERTIPANAAINPQTAFGLSGDLYGASSTGLGGYVPNCTVVPRPPQTLNEAQLIPDSVTWNADKGALVVPWPRSLDNEPQGTFGNRFTLAGTPSGSTPIDSLCDCDAAPNQTRQLFHNNAMTGIHFEGLLAGETTLRVTARWIVAETPSLVDEDDLIIAQRNGPPIRHLRQILSVVSRRMPVAVPVGENASGEWWDKIKGVLSGIAGALAPALGPELGPVVALGGKVLNALPAGATPLDQSVAQAGPKKLLQLLRSGKLSRQQQLVAQQRLMGQHSKGVVIHKQPPKALPGSGRTEYMRPPAKVSRARRRR
jgi:hypothetical protein